MIKVINIVKSFGIQTIFDNISFNINPGERIGLVGRNGHGKTTLLRMIIREDLQDSGEIVIPRHYSIGYVTQHIEFKKDTVLEESCLGLPDDRQEEKWKAEKILFGLGFNSSDVDRHPAEFSAGYQVRLSLAKVLVSEPNLLLLDEPTNFLDVVSIRWLSNYLRQWKNEFILITHDRGFMDNVITDVIGIHRKKIRKLKGNTDKLYMQILKEEEIYEKTRINDEKKKKETEQYITRFRAKARLAGLVQSRIKALEKKEKLEKLEWIKTLDFSFNYEPFPGKVLMDVSNLSFSYEKNKSPLIKNFNVIIGKKDRICVIGKNGEGKTTLLRLLAGELSPLNGEIKMHNITKIGYFAQENISRLNESLTIEEEIRNSGSENQRARNICGAMMFEGDMALKKIRIISGGEKSRVLLGKILATPANLLLLDEPTNHLDMETCDAFLAAVDNFDGAAIIVTHNEMFLHTLANRFIIFQNEKISLFEGSYQSFLDKVGWENEEPQSGKKKSPMPGTGIEEGLVNKSKKNIRKIRADISTRRLQALKPIKARISKVEVSITSLEKELNNLNREMIDASVAGDGNYISDLSRKIHRVKSDTDSLYYELEILTKEHDDVITMFEKEIDEIEDKSL